MQELPTILTLVAFFIVVIPSTMLDFTLLRTFVPTPYMDEIFHIGQTQQYCNSRWDYWDPKITTPPGSYLPAVAIAHILANAATFMDETFGLGDQLSKLSGETLTNLNHPGFYCNTTFIRGTNLAISGLLFVVIAALVRDLTYNPLYPTLRSIMWVQNTRNITSTYFFAECLILLQSIALWSLPFSMFFYGMAYTDTASTFSLVLVFLHGRRLVPFFSCEAHSMTRGYDLRRHLVVTLLCIWSVTIRQTNIVFLGLIAATILLQYVYHQHYYTQTVSSTSYPIPPLPQSPAETGTDASPPSSSKSPRQQPAVITPPPHPGTIHPALRLPSLSLTPTLSFPTSLKLLLKAPFQPHIFLALSPFLLTLGLFALFLHLNQGIVLGDKSNHQPALNPAQLPLFLAITSIFLPFFAKLPLMSTLASDQFWARKLDEEGPSAALDNEPPKPRKRSKCAIFWMIFGHIIGIGAIVYWFYTVLGNVFPHPFLLADNRHVSFTLYRFMTVSPSDFFAKVANKFTIALQENNKVATGLVRAAGVGQYYFLALTNFISPHLQTILSLIPSHIVSQLSSLVYNAWATVCTVVGSVLAKSNMGQLLVTPFALHTFYMVVMTNPLPALIWIIFSAITVIFTGLIEFRYYVPIVILSALVIQHQEGNIILRILQPYLSARITSPSRDANDDDNANEISKETEPFISWRALGWMLLVLAFNLVRFGLAYIFFFKGWEETSGVVQRYMW